MAKPAIHDFRALFPTAEFKEFKESLDHLIQQEIETAWQKVSLRVPPFSDSDEDLPAGFLTERAMAALYRAAHFVHSAGRRESVGTGTSRSVGPVSVTQSGEIFNPNPNTAYTGTMFGRAYLNLIRENEQAQSFKNVGIF